MYELLLFTILSLGVEYFLEIDTRTQKKNKWQKN